MRTDFTSVCSHESPCVHMSQFWYRLNSRQTKMTTRIFSMRKSQPNKHRWIWPMAFGSLYLVIANSKAGLRPHPIFFFHGPSHPRRTEVFLCPQLHFFIISTVVMLWWGSLSDSSAADVQKQKGQCPCMHYHTAVLWDNGLVPCKGLSLVLV